MSSLAKSIEAFFAKHGQLFAWCLLLAFLALVIFERL